MIDKIIELLEDIAAAVKSGEIDDRLTWVPADKAAKIIGVSTSTFRNRVATLPGFPKPNRPTGSKGDPRWNVGELHEWAKRNRDKMGRAA